MFVLTSERIVRAVALTGFGFPIRMRLFPKSSEVWLVMSSRPPTLNPEPMMCCRTPRSWKGAKCSF